MASFALDEPPANGRPPKEYRSTAFVYGWLRMMIGDGAPGFGPRARLASQSELAVRLTTSRPTVSKAFELLTDEGLIEWRMKHAYVGRTAGATVKLDGRATQHRKNERAPPKDEEILEGRRWLEGEAAFRAAQAATTWAELRQRLKDAIEDIEAGITVDDANVALRKDRRLHALIFAASRNSFEANVFHGAEGYALDSLAMSLAILWVEKRFRDEAFVLNRELFHRIMRGDPEGARGAAQRYVDYVAKKYREAKRQAALTP
jgi:DNA-binding FadR family transcriptional regulator